MSILLGNAVTQENVRLYSVPVTYNDDARTSGTALVFRGGLRDTSTSSAPRMYRRAAKAQLFIVPFPNPGGVAALDNVLLTQLEPWLPVTDAIEAALNGGDSVDDDDDVIGSVNDGSGRVLRRGDYKQQPFYKSTMMEALTLTAVRDLVRDGGRAPVPAPARNLSRTGAYRCALVPNADALLAMDLEKAGFQCPPDAAARLSVVRDASICPPSCGFVLVQCKDDVDSDDGFVVVYPSEDVMLPTCRQGSGTALRSSDGSVNRAGLVNYDVTCYVVGEVPQWRGAMCVTTKHVAYTPRLRAVMNVVDASMEGIDGVFATRQDTRMRVTVRRVGRVISKLRLYGSDVNANVFVSGRGDFDPETNAALGPSVEVVDAVLQLRVTRAGSSAGSGARPSVYGTGTADTGYCATAGSSGSGSGAGSALRIPIAGASAFDAAWQSVLAP